MSTPLVVCQICHKETADEDYIGCCRDGECPHEVEYMCRWCAHWNEDEGYPECPCCRIDADEMGCCSNCDCLLHEGIHIFCLEDREGATTVMCDDCWQTHEISLRVEGWAPNDESPEKTKLKALLAKAKLMNSKKTE